MPTVLVVGAGGVGLTAAIRLREAGIAGEGGARDARATTTSAVAAALWYPYRAFPRERVAGWSAHGFDVMCALADEPGSGVRMRWGRERVAPARPTRGGATPSRRSRGRRTGGGSPRRWPTCRCTCRGS